MASLRSRPESRLGAGRASRMNPNPFRPRMTSVVVFLVALTGLATMSSAQALPPGELPPRREIFVPFEDLDVLLQGQPQRVFLTRPEYEELLAKSRRAPEEHAPEAATLLTAAYDLTVTPGRGLIQGNLTLEVLRDGLHAIELPLNGVGVQRAVLDGRPAPLARLPDGKVVVFAEGRGPKKLLLELSTPVVASSIEQKLTFLVPTPAATSWKVTVPGDVEVRSGAVVSERRVDETDQVTRFQLLFARGPIALSLSLNSHLAQENRLVLARSVLVNHITTAFETIHAQVSFTVLQGRTDKLTLELPDGFEVTDVTAPNLARWSVEAGEPRRLEIGLREPAAGTIVAQVTAGRPNPTLEEWSLPTLRPREVARASSVVGLILDPRLKAVTLTPENLIPIDLSVLTAIVPTSGSDSAGSRVVAAYFAPQSEFSLRGVLAQPPRRMLVSTNTLVEVTGQGLKMHGAWNLSSEQEPIFSATFSLPPGWHPLAVKQGDNQPLTWEPLPSQGNQGATRIAVRLPAPIPAGQTATVLIDAELIPAGWVGSWQQQTFQLGRVRLEEMDREQGALALRWDTEFEVRPSEPGGLVPLDNGEKQRFGLGNTASQLAYLFDEAWQQATFSVHRSEALVKAKSTTFVRIEPGTMNVHAELAYDIRNTRVRQLALKLPADSPPAVTIRGVSGAAVREYTSEVEDEVRIWTVRLADEVQGSVRLAIDFQQPLTDVDQQTVVPPVVTAHEVDYGFAIVTVEGSADLNLTVTGSGREIDVGELADAEYQVGRRLLSVLEFVGTDPDVRIDVQRRVAFPLPAAILQRGELVTVVSTSGIAQTAARYQLRTKASYLEFRLPAGAELWAVTLDGKPMSPQRSGASSLLGIPPSANQEVRDLRIVYETPASRVLLVGTFAAEAPRLLLRSSSDADPVEVPTADLRWTLLLPKGYDVLRSSGTVFHPVNNPTPDWLKRMGISWYAISGGMPLFASRMAQAKRSSTDLAIPSLSRSFWDRRMDGDYLEKSAPLDGRMGGGMAGGMGSGGMGGGERMPAFGMMPGMGGPTPTAAPPVPPAAAEPLSELNGAPSPPKSEPEHAAKAEKQVVAQVRDLERTSAKPGEGAAMGEPLAAGTKSDRYWGMQGQKGLLIDLVEVGDSVVFESLGQDPRLAATVLDARRMQFLAWALGGIGLLLGLLVSRRSWPHKLRFAASLVAISLVLPSLLALVTDFDFEPAFEYLFYAGCLLPAIWVLGSLLEGTVRTIGGWRRATAMFLLLAALPAVASAQQPQTPTLESLLQSLPPPAPIVLPPDALIIPYDPLSEAGPRGAEKVLVPYERYLELVKLAGATPGGEPTPPPASFAWAGAAYETTLQGETQLEVRGTIELESFVAGSQEIPLGITNGVLTRAILDGQAAQIRIVGPDQVPAPNPPQQALQNAAPQAPQPIAVLIVQGKGRKRLEFSVRFPLGRDGGWRSITGGLPMTPVARATLVVPEPQTDLRLTAESEPFEYVTRQADERVDVPLGSQGQLDWRWRPKTMEAQVDQNLAATSTAVFDVREDSLQLTWLVNLEFRRSQRDRFALRLPPGYLLEKVSGDNLKGWQIQGEGDNQRVEILLLQMAQERAAFTLHLAQAQGVSGAARQIVVPSVAVAEAVLQQGTLLIRRSPLLDVRVGATNGVTRTEAPEAEQAVQKVFDESLAGIRPLAAFRFTSLPFSVALTAQPAAANLAAEIRTVVRLAAREVTWESQVVLQVRDRPVHELTVDLPSGYELDPPAIAVPHEWSQTARDDTQRVTIRFASGVSESMACVFRGRRLRDSAMASTSLPAVRVPSADRQAGYVVVVADPAFDVVPEGLENCESVLLTQVENWLAAEHRSLARVALHFRSPDYRANLRVVARQPRVQVSSITNVRISNRLIEETILLDYQITDAGIRELVFVVPERFSEARIQVPLLRQIHREPVADQEGALRIRLELQDEVTGDLRVLLETDSLLTGAKHQAPIPQLETGRVEHRYITWENVGRDEVVVEEQTGCEPLSRQQSAWQRLASILGGNITQAYLVRDQAEAPKLSFRTEQRSAVKTAGARIGLAETFMVVDPSGAYRAAQEWKMSNTTEPYLEVEFPPGAELWTVRVADEAVKPSRVSDATSPLPRYRIPLVKSAAGDPDYAVVVKYGGRLQPPSWLRPLEFPFLKTVNINVEWSQVRLRLPDDYRWFDFRGSMRRAKDESELTAGYVRYFTKQVEMATQFMDAGSDFTRARAQYNLKQLGQAFQSYGSAVAQSGDSTLRYDYDQNNFRLQQALQQAATAQSAPVVEFDNRTKLNEAWKGQANGRARNVVTNLNDNFDVAPIQPQPANETKPDVNTAWFAKSKFRGDIVIEGEKSRESDVQKRLDEKDEVAGAKGQTPAKPRFGRGELPRNPTSEQREAAPSQANDFAMPQTGETVREGKGEQIRRYQQRLETQNAQNALNSLNAPATANRANQGITTFEGHLLPMTAPQRAQASAAPIDASDVTNLGTTTGARGAVANTPVVPSGALASLDVQLPSRGQEFFFTTPRGMVELSARGVADRQINRSANLMLGLIVLFAGWAVSRLWIRVSGQVRPWVIGPLLMGTGLLSLVLGVFPVLGLVGLLGGMVIVIRAWRKRASTMTTVPARAI